MQGFKKLLRGGTVQERKTAVIMTIFLAMMATLIFAGQTQAKESSNGQRLVGTYAPPTGDISQARISSKGQGNAAECHAVASGEACIEWKPVSQKRRSLSLARVKGADASDATCSVTPGEWTYSRKSYCANLEGTYTLRDLSKPPKVTGTAVFFATIGATLSQTTGSWEEKQTMTVALTTDKVKSLSFSWLSNCTPSCTPTKPSPWLGSANLKMGQTAAGTSNYTANPGAGKQVGVTTSFAIQVVVPGVAGSNLIAQDNPRKVRCDTTFSNDTSTGCVISDVQPQLVLPLSQYGAAAATYAWAQQKLIDRWGTAGNPLRRLGDEAIAKANRTRTCGSGASRPFIPLPNEVTDDSCDEYPFAGTLEGGKNGALCADVVPKLQNGVWNFYQDPNSPAFTGNEPCIRGHVPSGQNSAAGGKFGANNQAERIIPDEKFQVVIS